VVLYNMSVAGVHVVEFGTKRIDNTFSMDLRNLIPVQNMKAR